MTPNRGPQVEPTYAQALEATVADYRRVLTYYADPRVYLRGRSGKTSWAARDQGSMARTVLEAQGVRLRQAVQDSATTRYLNSRRLAIPVGKPSRHALTTCGACEARRAREARMGGLTYSSMWRPGTCPGCRRGVSMRVT